MAKPLMAVVNQLADVLDRENAALKAMDLPRAAGLLVEKTAAIADLTTAGDTAPASPDPALAPIARRLDGLARENRRLLERAIIAQQRVIGIVVRAAASVAAQPCYGARGGAYGGLKGGANGRRAYQGAMALSTRA